MIGNFRLRLKACIDVKHRLVDSVTMHGYLEAYEGQGYITINSGGSRGGAGCQVGLPLLVLEDTCAKAIKIAPGLEVDWLIAFVYKGNQLVVHEYNLLQSNLSYPDSCYLGTSLNWAADFLYYADLSDIVANTVGVACYSLYIIVF